MGLEPPHARAGRYAYLPILLPAAFARAGVKRLERPRSQLRVRSKRPRGRVRGDNMGGGPAAAPRAGSDETMGRTDTDGNNNFPGVKSNYKIYKHAVT